MSEIKELIRTESDGTISFGDYTLSEKTKRSDYEYDGDLYKVKTFADITKLERNGMFVYESVPGTAVHHFHATGNGVSFEVEGTQDVQIILGLEEDAQYKVYISDTNTGTMETKMGGKLVLSVEVSGCAGNVPVKVVKL
ncbi:MAG: endosialidase [Lachnospiraceae bacterium]|uniref:endosialidase n=1 Tax=Parablautia sp. Marseille-Q6255 TaxID=3039593 RepID=UPI0024BCDE9A|nr:endosialidase [Parablautia sp. Marseille-Q6255]